MSALRHSTLPVGAFEVPGGLVSMSDMSNYPNARQGNLRMYSRVQLFIRQNIAEEAVRAITWIVAVFSVGIGISLFVTSFNQDHISPFTLNFKVAPPHVWGIGFAFLGVWTIGSLILKSQPRLPCYFLSFLSGIWGILTVADILISGFPATAVVAYTAMGAVAFVCGIAQDDIDEDGLRT